MRFCGDLGHMLTSLNVAETPENSAATSTTGLTETFLLWTTRSICVSPNFTSPAPVHARESIVRGAYTDRSHSTKMRPTLALLSAHQDELVGVFARNIYASHVGIGGKDTKGVHAWPRLICSPVLTLHFVRAATLGQTEGLVAPAASTVQSGASGPATPNWAESSTPRTARFF